MTFFEEISPPAREKDRGFAPRRIDDVERGGGVRQRQHVTDESARRGPIEDLNADSQTFSAVCRCTRLFG